MQDTRFTRPNIKGGPVISPYEGDLIKAQVHGIVGNDEESLHYVKGVKSIMNEYAIMTLSGASNKGDENKLFDTATGSTRKKWYEQTINKHDGDSRDPSVSKLIAFAESDKIGRRPYAYKDFVFNKHFDFIPNNRLITLRRFAAPTVDSLDFPGMDSASDNSYVPVAQAITYFGENTENTLAQFFSISTELPWEDMEAKLWDITPPSNTGADSLPKVGGIAKMLSVATGDASASSIRNAGTEFADPYASGPYMNKVKGPVNRIDKVKKRTPGLKMSQTLNLVFEYNPRPFNGMNSKAIAHDILANMYTLTYGSAPFWGGENRFRNGGNAYPMKGLMKKWYSGDAMGFMSEGADAAGQGFSNIFGAIGDIFSGGGIGALKNIVKKGANLGMATMVAGKRDTFLGMRSLLTGEPVGEWHITVGNPLNPIMEMGNMIVSKMDVSASEVMGPDDFPETIKFTVTLEHGMPRDSDSIQSMFNRGNGKIYKMPDELMKNLASLNETSVDKKTGTADAAKASAAQKIASGNTSTMNASYAMAGAVSLGYGSGEPKTRIPAPK